MPIPHASRYPVESFDPRFRDLWLRSALEVLEISFPTHADAIAFRNRAQLFRAAVKRETPSDSRVLYRSKCSVVGTLVRFFPHDMQFADVLSQVRPAPGSSPGESLIPEEAPTPIPDATSQPSPGISFDDLFAGISIEKGTE